MIVKKLAIRILVVGLTIGVCAQLIASFGAVGLVGAAVLFVGSAYGLARLEEAAGID